MLPLTKSVLPPAEKAESESGSTNGEGVVASVIFESPSVSFISSKSPNSVSEAPSNLNMGTMFAGPVVLQKALLKAAR